MTFDEWVNGIDRHTITKAESAYYTVAQEFQSGDFESQEKAILEVMRLAWNGCSQSWKMQTLGEEDDEPH